VRTALAPLIICGLSMSGVTQAQEQAGAVVFKACQSCHSLDPAKAGMAGPHLAGLNGRVLGSAQSFDYSPGFKAAKAQGFRWDRERLLGYLADPDAVVPGGWMSPPAGLTAADRTAVANYLLGR
jgi:cytochrome c